MNIGASSEFHQIGCENYIIKPFPPFKKPTVKAYNCNNQNKIIFVIKLMRKNKHQVTIKR
jgi:hypothetical protein